MLMDCFLKICKMRGHQQRRLERPLAEPLSRFCLALFFWSGGSYEGIEFEQERGQETETTSETASAREVKIEVEAERQVPALPRGSPCARSRREFLESSVCECPSCSERVLVCSYPGCTDFVVGGDYWDNALCPEHGKELTDRAKELGTTVAMLLVTLWTKSKFTKK